MAYQSLYRRYRPQKFSEIKGQRHVVAALQNAVVKDEVGHAYMLHGPRGTGKTTSARVLAKALNCEDRGADGEPCGECESCVAIEQGRSFDLHELDAASNNGVDAMRDLLAKVNLGTPGRAKVYILDEVHMLTAGAENALLKTLEEPPPHVTWVLATTEPHKVVPTIRSRCQVFELNLLGAAEMEAHLRWMIDDASLDVDQAAIDHVIEVGGGSVRDTLSALDGVVAAGGLIEINTSTPKLLEALVAHDSAAALLAVIDATGRGADPRRIAETAVSALRDAFLVAMGSPPATLAGRAKERAEEIAAKASPAALTRALEIIGTTLITMRQAPDPRVALEVALVRICRVESDQSIDALTQRIEQLERRLDSGVAPTAPVAPAPPAPVAPAPVAVEPSEAAAGPAAARRQLSQGRSSRSGDSAATLPASANSPLPPAVPPRLPISAQSESQLVGFAPTSPAEIVDMGVSHLGLTRDFVIGRANELLGTKAEGGTRTPEDLSRLWADLVNGHEDAVEPEPEPEPAHAVVEDVQPDRGGRREEVDLTDLVDAPTHDDRLLDQLNQAFPGAELLPTTEDETND